MDIRKDLFITIDTTRDIQQSEVIHLLLDTLKIKYFYDTWDTDVIRGYGHICRLHPGDLIARYRNGAFSDFTVRENSVKFGFQVFTHEELIEILKQEIEKEVEHGS